ncbi:rod shape-determining protein MreC [Kangiella sediminilitoris]|uniref:rod shape-determining protein MreC n=1 Tax=Kangiella sediminilitoris TaxID=1144748 RepID=UPI000901247F|nr:rod shape-determining protein MreC [Kangiella sediminilitoris]
MKNIFTQGPSLLLQLLFSLLLASLMMVLDYRYDYLSSARKGVSTVFAPIYFLANLPNEIASWADNNIVSRNDLIDQNRRLKDELLILKAQNQRLIGLESENARLRSLLGSSRTLRGKRVIAEVLNIDSSLFANELILNKGSMDDVFVGQPVVDAEGIMGQIVEVSTSTSRMILINDQKHAIPVRIDRNGVRAIAQGNGRLLYLRHLPNTIDVKEGDILLSSGLGQRFPDGYPVAKVISVVRQTAQPYAEIQAEPTANINRANHVLLLWPYHDPKVKDPTNPEVSQSELEGETGPDAE